MSDVQNVTYGKPKIGGAIYRAPLGTTLPTNVTDALNAAFVELGHLSDDGLTNNNTATTEHINDWGGDPVLYIQTEKEDTWTFTLIDTLSVDVLKAIYGDGNVTGTLSTGISVSANAVQQPNACWVFDMLMRDGAAKRVVLPNAGISEVGEIVYRANEAVGYPTTLAAVADESGNTHYEYIKR